MDESFHNQLEWAPCTNGVAAERGTSRPRLSWHRLHCTQTWPMSVSFKYTGQTFEGLMLKLWPSCSAPHSVNLGFHIFIFKTVINSHIHLNFLLLIVEYLGQKHGCWCPGSLHRQVISSHVIDHVGWTGTCHLWGSISITCAYSVLRYGRKWKCVLCSLK